MKYEELNTNAFKPIKENPIILDFTGCRYSGEVHLVLKTKFGLPDYYGENWDALWDCMDGLFCERGAFKINIYGFMTLPYDLREHCGAMLKVFEDVHKETPNVTFELIS